MKLCVFVLLVLIHSAAPVPHSQRNFYTSSSQVPNFPEFAVVGFVDDVQIVHYDSDTQRAEPKQDWIRKLAADLPKYLARETRSFMNAQQSFKGNIETVKQRFNHTGGVHILQWMSGCEWDDETGEVKGYNRFGYDGEDFISLDLQSLSWVAAKQQAFITKMKWDNDTAELARYKNYYTQRCPYWLKKYVTYGQSTLNRTVLPSMSLLQKSPSSPVTCHASGFYPDRIMMFWEKDGEEVHEGVEPGVSLPNHDGTYQRSVHLDLSSVPPADWEKYECVFKISGAQMLSVKLDLEKIRTNWGHPPSDMTTISIIIAVAVVALVVLAAVGSVVIYKKKNAKCPPSSETSSESTEKLNPPEGKATKIPV
ncbi:class I histocompatibility antigen, F10 alpha chain-like [Genypterus blacodes]|uniref:class I histocompatibility antigen, F10 alpha chain-like n=1 Tax=Genypterus blacodes TaxID=154954 RepID=UPI003F76ECB6